MTETDKIKAVYHEALFEWLNDIENRDKELRFWDADDAYRMVIE